MLVASLNKIAPMEGRRGTAWDANEQRGLCAFCTEEATTVVELQVSAKPARGERRPRGKRMAGVTRRLCERHALMFYGLLKNGPRRQEDK